MKFITFFLVFRIGRYPTKVVNILPSGCREFSETPAVGPAADLHDPKLLTNLRVGTTGRCTAAASHTKRKYIHTVNHKRYFKQLYRTNWTKA